VRGRPKWPKAQKSRSCKYTSIRRPTWAGDGMSGSLAPITTTTCRAASDDSISTTTLRTRFARAAPKATLQRMGAVRPDDSARTPRSAVEPGDRPADYRGPARHD
jgi:hypothetical protein